MSVTTLPKGLRGSSLVRFHEGWQSLVPQLYAVLLDVESFQALRVYRRDDGSCLAVLKAFGSVGDEMVCFGAGPDVIAAILSLEGTIAAGNWKLEKPWGDRN